MAEERRFKGRGSRSVSGDDAMELDGKVYDRLGSDKPSDAPVPQKSIEGFFFFVLFFFLSFFLSFFL
jgi:hypothetical protein